MTLWPHYDKPVDRYMAKAREDNVRFVAYLHREKIFAELFPRQSLIYRGCLD